MIDTRFYLERGPKTLGQLLAGLRVEMPFDKYLDEEISLVADLATSKPGEISFLSSRKYKSSLDTARATACFCTDDCAGYVGEQDIIPIVSSSPKAHFARTIEQLYEKREPNEYLSVRSPVIHPSAVIADDVELGDNVRIGPFVVIGSGVKIGARTKIASYVSIECTEIGEDCTIKSGSCIGSRGFGVEADEKGIFDLPHVGRVIIGDRVSIGSQTTIDRGFVGDTILEHDVKIDNLVQVAHNVIIGSGSMLAGHVGISGSCVIGKNVLLGGSVGLADHITIGDNARLAARAGVMHNVPAGETWSGIPAMPIRDHMRMINATRKLANPKKKKL